MIAVLLLDDALLLRAPAAFGPADVLVGVEPSLRGPLQGSMTGKTSSGSHRWTVRTSDCFSHIVVELFFTQQLDQTLT